METCEICKKEVDRVVDIGSQTTYWSTGSETSRALWACKDCTLAEWNSRIMGFESKEACASWFDKNAIPKPKESE